MVPRLTIIKQILNGKSPLSYKSYLSININSIINIICSSLNLERKYVSKQFHQFKLKSIKSFFRDYAGLYILFIYYYFSNGYASINSISNIRKLNNKDIILADMLTSYILNSTFKEKHKLFILMKDLVIGSTYETIYLSRSTVIETIEDLDLEYQVLYDLIESFIIIPRNSNPFYLKGDTIDNSDFQWAIPCLPRVLVDMSYNRYLLNLYSLCCSY